jgi:sulfhydrogenase subunit beta (sulfur reductase)
MKLAKFDKKQWAEGLDSLRESFRLLGPVKENTFYSFKELEVGEQPNFIFLNTRLSPKSILFPQSEAIVEYSLDSHKEDHHVMKAIETDASPRAILGIRPCDAKSVTLVNLNFDTP